MLEDFFYTYFVEPIIGSGVQGYNLVNTITYIIILVIACYIIFRLLKNRVEFDYKFFFALIPYILFGVCMRVIMHFIELGEPFFGITKTANPLEFGFWFFTPGIWILTFFLVLIGLLIGRIDKKLSRKKLFWFGCFVSGWPIMFVLLSINNLIWLVGTALLIILVSFGLCWLVNNFTKYKILSDPMNLMIVLGQGIDGIASTIAITFFSFTEQHVLSKILIDIHPIIFVIVKLSLGILIAYSLDDYLLERPKTKQKQKIVEFIKLVIAILGFATGLASLIKLGVI
jgi:uncharacterized membrane protein